jgi:hypothetical protein
MPSVAVTGAVCRQQTRLLLVWLAFMLLPAAAHAAAGGGDSTAGRGEVYSLGLSECSAMSLTGSVTSARCALAELEDPVERRTQFSQVITGLIGLYQLHGCEWALPALQQVYAFPDSPDLHFGYSTDGRLGLRLEPMQLRNPAFTDYTLLLCTLSSLSALDVTAIVSNPITIRLLDGTEVEAQHLTPEHELWRELGRLASTFEPPVALPAGAAIAFKQVLAVPGLSSGGIAEVSLEWGRYTITVPYYENEVEQ